MDPYRLCFVRDYARARFNGGIDCRSPLRAGRFRCAARMNHCAGSPNRFPVVMSWIFNRRWLILLLLISGTAHAEQVVFSKLMYNPPPNQPEYIEIANNTATPFDMANWQ